MKFLKRDRHICGGYDYLIFIKGQANEVNRDLTTIQNSIYKDIKVTAKSLVTQTDIVHLK